MENHSRRAYEAVVIALSLSCLATFDCVANDDQLRARFESEAPSQWAKFAEIAKHLHIEFTEKQIRSAGEVEIRTSLKKSDANALDTIMYVTMPEKRKNRIAERVTCRNSSYAFALSKEKPDGPWFVASVGSADSLDEQLKHLDSITLFAYRVFDRTLSNWSRSPEFTVKDVDWVERPSVKLAAISFECAKPEDDTTYWIRSGTLHLNPDRMWSIQECEYEGVDSRGDTQRATQANTFRPNPDNLPLVKRSTLDAVFSGGTLKVITDFSRFEQRQVPETEFTLSAFGLPEIYPPSSRWPNGRLWFALVGAGILCIVVAIALRWRAAT